MAHYISKRELKDLERDRKENCGTEGFRYMQHRTANDVLLSDRQRRKLEREKRKDLAAKEKQYAHTVQTTSLSQNESHYNETSQNEDILNLTEEGLERLEREVKRQEDEIEQIRMENERKERMFLESRKRSHDNDIRSMLLQDFNYEQHMAMLDLESRSLDEMLLGNGKPDNSITLNHTYHGPEKEIAKRHHVTQNEHAYQNRIPFADTYLVEHAAENRNIPRTNNDRAFVTMSGQHDMKYKPERKRVEDIKGGIDRKNKTTVDQKDHLMSRIDRKKYSTVDQKDHLMSLIDRKNETTVEHRDQFMTWIDQKFDELSEHDQTYEDDSHGYLSEDSEKSDEEESDEELIRMQRDIEMLKNKDITIINQVKEKEYEKKQKEEVFKRVLEEQRREQEKERNMKMIEKEKMKKKLKEEQMRLLTNIRDNQKRLHDIDNSGFDHTSQQKSIIPHHNGSQNDRKLLRYKDNQQGDIPDSYLNTQYSQPKVLEPKLPKLTEESFEEWKVEVEIMMKSASYPEDSLMHCVRNSINNASRKIRKVLSTIPNDATTADILEKLDNIYGDRRSGESHLAEFYKSKQNPDENVAEWGVRLEIILQKAWKKGQITKDQMDQMLRRRFWKYLFSEKLKLNTRIHYEHCTNFEDLRKEIRIEENEMNIEIDSISSQSQPIDCQPTQKIYDVNDLVERVKRLEMKATKKETNTLRKQPIGKDDQVEELLRRLEKLEKDQGTNTEGNDIDGARCKWERDEQIRGYGRGRARYRQTEWRYPREDGRYRREENEHPSWNEDRRDDRYYRNRYRSDRNEWRRGNGNYGDEFREEKKDDRKDGENSGQQNKNYTYHSGDQHRNSSNEQHGNYREYNRKDDYGNTRQWNRSQNDNSASYKKDSLNR